MKYLGLLLLVLLVSSSLILLNTIYPVLPGVANITRDIGQNITDNWREFLFGKKDSQVDVEPTMALDKEALLAAYIKAEVDKAIEARLNKMTQANSGLVVMPANQASTTAADIARSFSDPVAVYPDATGRSGVIIPNFRDSRGEPYLYILTPLKQ